MKNLALLFSIIIIIFACKKEEETPVVINGCTNPDATNYNANATNDDGSCEYLQMPVADFDYSANNNFAPTKITFTNYSVNSDTYLWDFGDGNSSSEQDPEHIYTQEGNYFVSLTASMSSNNSTHTDTIIISATPSKLKLLNITINAMPFTKADGSAWDIGAIGFELPDVFYVLKKGSSELISSSSQDNVSSCPISFAEGLPYNLLDLYQSHSLEIRDNDEVVGFGGDELIGKCNFTPSEYMPNATEGGVYPTEINISNANIDMTLEIQWLQ